MAERKPPTLREAARLALARLEEEANLFEIADVSIPDDLRVALEALRAALGTNDGW